MANLNWLELYLLSNALLMIMMSISSSKPAITSITSTKLTAATKKWKW